MLRMDSRATGRPGVDARLAAAALAIFGLVVTMAMMVVRLSPALGDSRHRWGVSTVDDLQEGQFATAAAIVLIFIGAVLVGRYRRELSHRNLMLASAMFVLAIDSFLTGVFSASFDSLSESTFATWATAVASVIAAVLLVGSVLLPDRRPSRGHTSARLVLTGVAVALGCVILGVWLARERLPTAYQRPPVQPEDIELLSEHPALLLVEVVNAVGFAVASAALGRRAVREQDELLAWLSAGTTALAVAYLNYALFPSRFTELLFLGDYFFLFAVSVLLVGAVREIGNAQARLVRRVAYEERRRIAQDLHDGVAQELALLTTQARSALRDPDPALLNRLLDTVEKALDEARDAIDLLNLPSGDSLPAAIEQAATRAAARGGATVEVDLDPAVQVPRDVYETLVRITREAVTNAVKHGNARRVSVELWGETGAFLRVCDDGRGFEESLLRVRRGHGLIDMRERTESLGGDFKISSVPQQGTTVEVAIP